MKDKMLKWVVFTFLFIVAVGSLIFIKGDEAEGWTGSFEDNITLTYIPQHPIDDQSVNVTIESHGAIISAANLNAELIYPGGDHSSGGFQFQRINATKMFVTIPGYRGGTQVRFTVTAWDEEASPITSPQFTYVVQKVGGWTSNDFKDNIKVNWDKTAAQDGKTFNITIESKDPTITIQRAILNFVIHFPSFEVPQEGANVFTPINDTYLVYKMNPYPGGSNITWWIEAYDRYSERIESDRFQYKIPTPPTPPPTYNVTLTVYVYDVKNSKAADGAHVTFSNSTWSYSTKSVGGFAFTPYGVREGDYNIIVKYGNSTQQKSIHVPSPMGYVIKFKVNPLTYRVNYPLKESLSLQAISLPILFIIILILSPHFYRYTEELKERYKMEKRRGKEIMGKEGKFVRWLLSDKRNGHIRGVLFFFLAFLGMIWAPFYPVWLSFIIALGLGALGIRYPYLSTILLVLMVAPAASYQSVNFGWFFLVFSLMVLFIGFFDYRFSYLVFLTLFSANFGGAYLVPILGSVLLGPVLGVSAAVIGGIFILLILYGSDLLTLPPLAVPSHDLSFITFSRIAPDKFTPSLWIKSMGNLSYPQTQVISKVLSENMQSTAPFLMIILWAALAYLAYKYTKEKKQKKLGRYFRDFKGISPILFVVISYIILYVYVGGEMNYILPLYIIRTLITIALSGILYSGKELLFSEEVDLEKVPVKSLADMGGFRKTSFEKVGGLKEIKEELKQAIMVPLLEPEIAEKYGVKPSKGILLFGPPGCGKTLLLRAIASELHVEMISVKCSDIMSKWYGESENAITQLMEEARRRRPAILLLDEIDAIAKRRDFYTTDDVTPRILSLMLSELDGLEETEGIIVVGTTNMPDLVDPALLRPGRFDKVIYVPPPLRRAREEILRIHMKGKYIGRDVNVKRLSEMTNGFSGADLENVVREAASIALSRALKEGKEVPIRMDDFMEALRGLKPSITEEMLRSYDKLRHEHERKKKNIPLRRRPRNEWG